jgi:UPF0716 family protein affecting phage T7 exclusion
MGIFRVLLMLGIVVKFWWLFLLVLAFAAAGFLLWGVLTRQDAAFDRQHREHAAMTARADEQHAWFMAGDDRGIYGAYPPNGFSGQPEKDW